MSKRRAHEQDEIAVLVRIRRGSHPVLHEFFSNGAGGEQKAAAARRLMLAGLTGSPVSGGGSFDGHAADRVIHEVNDEIMRVAELLYDQLVQALGSHPVVAQPLTLPEGGKDNDFAQGFAKSFSNAAFKR